MCGRRNESWLIFKFHFASTFYLPVTNMFHSAEVTVDAVREHLKHMKLFFEETSPLTRVELYGYLLNLACKYEKAREDTQNFAKIVHMLHPRSYLQDR